MNVKLDMDTEQLKGIVSEAILQSLDTQKRDALIVEAMRYLMTPERHGSWGPNVSPLQQAFNDALFGVARQIAREMLEQNEQMVGQLKSIIAEGTHRAFTEKREDTIANISAAIVKAFELK